MKRNKFLRKMFIIFGIAIVLVIISFKKCASEKLESAVDRVFDVSVSAIDKEFATLEAATDPTSESAANHKTMGPRELLKQACSTGDLAACTELGKKK